MAKNELTVASNFQLVTGFEDMDPELMEELKDEMQDLDDERGIACKQIKIPAGGGKAYEIETDDPDDPEIAKEIEGVIIFTHRMNSYWEGDFGSDDGNKVPTCSSIDAKQGVNMQTGEIADCERCPLNQYPADGSGKPCKNIRRVYILRSGNPDIFLLSVPPTSLKDVNKQLAKIMGSKKIPYTRMVVTFGLEGAKNKGGIAYSKITVKQTAMLPPEIFAKTQELRKQLKEKYMDVAITASDYNAAATGDDFVEVPEGSAEELPFSN